MSRPRPARTAAQVERSAPHEIRIIGGDWRRTKLPVLNKPGLRPTPDRVRETLFNWLGQSLAGWRVLDAFAGTGALGFETASRGASQVTLLEAERDLVRHLQAMQQRLLGLRRLDDAPAPQITVQAADALGWMARQAPRSFELIFLDPPFDGDVFAAAASQAARIVTPGGFVYLEANRAFDAEPATGLTLWRSGRAGLVHYHLFQKGEAPGNAPATLG